MESKYSVVSFKKETEHVLYQLFLQGSDPFLVKGLLVRQLLLGHHFGHLDSLHHLFFCLHMGLFNFCLQPNTYKVGLRGIPPKLI